MRSDTEQRAPGVRAVERFLTDAAVTYRVVHHEPTYAARDEARVSWVPAEQTAKTLILHDGEQLVVAAVPACERLDLPKLRAALDRHRTLQLADEVEIAARFPGYEVGAVPPFGPEAVAAHVVDRRLLTFNRVLCSAGDHRHSVLVDAMELVRVADAVVADVCVDDR